MTNTLYTQPVRLAIINRIFKQITMPTYDIYMGLYVSDPIEGYVEVDVQRYSMPPAEWTVTSSAIDAYVTNTREISFVDVPDSIIDGILLFDSDLGADYLFADSFVNGPITVTSDHVLTFAAGALRISFDEA